jgi:AcrR family transcriptional regulator
MMREKKREKRDPEQRRAEILAAAFACFAERGFAATRMEDVAARAGIAKGTLYLHFARKEDLVFALLDRELQTVMRVVEQADSMGGTAREKLVFIQASLYRGLLGKRAQLLYILYNGADLKSVLRDKHGEVLRRIAGRITALLDEGKASGPFDAELPTDVMVNTFFSVLSPRAYKHLVLDKQMAPDELVRHIERIYFRGIAAAEI